jgi:hypothetical protein
MTEVEISRRLGQLHLMLNQVYLKQLITEIRKSENLESMKQPYRSWLTDSKKIQSKYLTDSAKKVRRGE